MKYGCLGNLKVWFYIDESRRHRWWIACGYRTIFHFVWCRYKPPTSNKVLSFKMHTVILPAYGLQSIFHLIQIWLLCNLHVYPWSQFRWEIIYCHILGQNKQYLPRVSQTRWGPIVLTASVLLKVCGPNADTITMEIYQGPVSLHVLLAIQIRWKFRLTLVQSLFIRSQQSFAHATTTHTCKKNLLRSLC